MKRCKKCKKLKNFSEFFKHQKAKDKLDYWCKKCSFERIQKWRNKNKERIKSVYKKWKEKNRKHLAERQKKWRKENPEYNWRKNNKIRINEYQRKWRKRNSKKVSAWFRWYRKNPKIKLDRNFGDKLRFSLKGKKAGRSWETLVGYTLQDLICHLEKQFDEKMSWDNYGSYWHIDHIVPKSWFPYQTAEEQAFKDCWALANLQLLEGQKNMIKSNCYIS